MTDLVVFDAKWAEGITERIRQTGEDFSALLLEAHDGQAWKLKGYKTWAAYVSAEFTFNRQRSYQLLAQGRANKVLAEAGSDVRVTEREARELSTTVDRSTIEAEVTERRAQPKPKKRHGPPGLEGMLVRWRDEREKLTEALEDEEALDYLDAAVRARLEREASQQFDFWERMCARLSRPRIVRATYDD